MTDDFGSLMNLIQIVGLKKLQQENLHNQLVDSNIEITNDFVIESCYQRMSEFKFL